MNLAIRTLLRAQFPVSDEFSERCFHLPRTVRYFLFQKPPLNNPSNCVLGRWIVCQIVQNLQLNWRFALQDQKFEG
jgi:hypothetical protein